MRVLLGVKITILTILHFDRGWMLAHGWCEANNSVNATFFSLVSFRRDASLTERIPSSSGTQRKYFYPKKQ